MYILLAEELQRKNKEMSFIRGTILEETTLASFLPYANVLPAFLQNKPNRT